MFAIYLFEQYNNKNSYFVNDEVEEKFLPILWIRHKNKDKAIINIAFLYLFYFVKYRNNMISIKCTRRN